MPVHALSASETLGGDKYVEVQLRLPGIQTGTDAYGQPTYDEVIRLYLNDVPGGPAWPPARINTAVALFQAMLPQGLWIVDVSEESGKAHINFAITRKDPNG